MLKKIITEKLVESSLSMKTRFVDGERNRLKSAIKSSPQSKKRRLSGGGRKPFLRNLKEELVEKIIDEREKHHHVPCKLIIVWAQQLDTE